MALQQIQGQQAAKTTLDSGLPESDNHTIKSAVTAADTVKPAETVSNVPTTPDTTTTVVQPLDAVAQRHDACSAIATAATSLYANRETALQALHHAVRGLLSMVGLEGCFHGHQAFPYSFYLEYPDFQNIPQTNPQAVFAIDHLHEEAGNVFAFLCRVSGQDMLMGSAFMEAKNPILMLPKTSAVRAAYQDADILDEYSTMGIGERVYLLDRVLEWQTADTPYTAPVAAILTAMRAVRAFDMGGSHA